MATIILTTHSQSPYIYTSLKILSAGKQTLKYFPTDLILSLGPFKICLDLEEKRFNILYRLLITDTDVLCFECGSIKNDIMMCHEKVKYNQLLIQKPRKSNSEWRTVCPAYIQSQTESKSNKLELTLLTTCYQRLFACVCLSDQYIRKHDVIKC